MQENNFAVVGNTINEEKYAFKIKQGLIDHGYHVYGVGKELDSLNDIEDEIDVIDLCINPVKGLHLIKECKKPFKCIVIQPGGESNDLIDYLKQENLPHIEGCVLVGLSLYAKN